MVGIALLGAGLYAKDQHLPALQESVDFELVAVYSRSQQSAEALANGVTAGPKPQVYHDSPGGPGKSLDDLLARSDIGAVVVCLPILTQPEVIKKALSAGKHVLSEKPVAKDVATAKELIAWHAALPNAPLWAVGENFRYMSSLEFAASKVKELGGKVVAFHLHMYNLIPDDDKYLNTPWRKVPEYQGGFLLDGGVHFVAALRLLLGAAGDDVTKLACFSALNEKKLPPVDTVHAVASTRGGSGGTLSVSFGTEFKSGLDAEVVTTAGAVIWNPVEVRVIRKDASGQKQETKETFTKNSGVKAETAAFAKSIQAGALNPLLSPEEALKDLNVIQSLLQSGESNATVQNLE